MEAANASGITGLDLKSVKNQTQLFLQVMYLLNICTEDDLCIADNYWTIKEQPLRKEHWAYQPFQKKMLSKHGIAH